MVSGQLRRHQGELYVLCHSAARASKDRAIRQRFEHRLEEDADKLKARVAAGRLKKPDKINRAAGQSGVSWAAIRASRVTTRCRSTATIARWPTIRDRLATHQMVTIVHQCTDGTVLRLRRPSQPELEHRTTYRTLRIPATPPLPGRNRL